MLKPRALAGVRLLAHFTPSRHLPQRPFSKTSTRMVEGHQCHRVGHFHRAKLLNRAFKASSPNGRFAAGAAEIDGKPLRRIEVHGKNLFYFFGDGPPVCLHFHFGMSGAFVVHKMGENEGRREPKPTTRLELVNEEGGIVAHLSAMTVQYGDLDFYEAKVKALGEDPLREDARPEVAWGKVAKSKKPIGLLLMDQSVIAGVGNIYRAEILFKAGVHPEQPGCTLGRAAFDAIWLHSVALLRRGFQSGSILTVDPEEAEVLGPPWTRRYLYNQARCGRCSGAVQTWDMASRKVYACPACQPLVGGAGLELPAARRAAMRATAAAVEFVSRCAPDEGSDAATPPAKLTLARLRARLAAAGLLTSGRKAELVARLEAVTAGGDGGSREDEETAAVPTPAPKQRAPSHVVKRAKRSTGNDEAAVQPEVYEWDLTGAAGAVDVIAPGTAGLSGIKTAREAAVEKALAGEGRNTEHVALHDDEEAQALNALGERGERRRRVMHVDTA